MIDYFCFSPLSQWPTDESLEEDGFVYYKTPRAYDRTYSSDPVEQLRLEKKHTFLHVYTKMCGLELQQAVVTDHAMDLNSVPHFEKVLPSLKILSFDRSNYSHYGAENLYFDGRYRLKKVVINNIFPNWADPHQNNELQFLASIMASEIEELFITFRATNLRESHVELFLKCKAKRLQITVENAGYYYHQRRLSLKLLRLQNLSSIFYKLDDNERGIDHFLMPNVILNNRGPILQHVGAEDSEWLHKMMFDGKELNKQLHTLLLDVSIALNSSLEFGVYEIYFTVKLLPEMRGHNEYTVIQTLHRVRNSIAKVKERKEKSLKIEV